MIGNLYRPSCMGDIVENQRSAYHKRMGRRKKINGYKLNSIQRNKNEKIKRI